MDEWMIWLAVMVTWFLAMELPALASRQAGDTLSEHVWRWLKVRGRMVGWKAAPFILARGGIILFLLWLAGHLAMGWWTL